MYTQNYGKIVFSLLTKKLPFECYCSVSLTFIENFYRNSEYTLKKITLYKRIRHQKIVFRQLVWLPSFEVKIMDASRKKKNLFTCLILKFFKLVLKIAYYCHPLKKYTLYLVYTSSSYYKTNS